MRSPSQKQKIQNFISELGLMLKKPATIYFTGGVTAVLNGIRESTIDVDIKFEPEENEIYKAIQLLKEKLDMNIELASPDNFIPPLPQWRERSVFIKQSGKIEFFHYDLYSQIISKVQRGWNQDLDDARGFLKLGADKKKLLQLFIETKPAFIKYPALNPEILERKLKKFIHEN